MRTRWLSLQRGHGWKGLLVLLAGAAVWGGGLLRSRSTVPVPRPKLAQANPEVVKTIERARQRVQDDPASGADWGHLGMVLMAHHCRPEALACFQQAARREPKNFRWVYYSAVLYEKTDLQRAAGQYARAARLRPDYAPLRFRWAQVLAKLNRLNEAEKRLHEAARLAPQSPHPLLALARLARTRGDLDSARQGLESAMTRAPRERSIRLELATIAYLQGDLDSALHEKQEASRLRAMSATMPDPYLQDVENFEAVGRRNTIEADALAVRGDLEGLEHTLRGLIRDRPDLTRPRLNLAQMLFHQNRLDEAIAEYRRLLNRSPDNALAYYGFGMALQAKGDSQAAIHAYRNAVRFKPDYADAHFALGLLLEKQGELEKATESYRRAVQANREFAPAHLALGVALQKAGKPDAALPHLRTAVRLAPQDPLPREYLDRARSDRGRAEDSSKKGDEYP